MNLRFKGGFLDFYSCTTIGVFVVQLQFFIYEIGE